MLCFLLTPMRPPWTWLATATMQMCSSGGLKYGFSGFVNNTFRSAIAVKSKAGSAFQQIYKYIYSLLFVFDVCIFYITLFFLNYTHMKTCFIVMVGLLNVLCVDVLLCLT